MKKPLVVLPILGIGILGYCLIATPLAIKAQQNQARAGQSSGTNLVVVDVVHLLRNYNQWHKAKADITADIKAYEQLYKKRTQEITKRQEQLKELKKNTPQYRQLVDQITRMVSDLKVNAALEQRSFREKEANLLFNCYRNIEYEIRLLAKYHKIKLVLNFDRRVINEDTPAQEMMRGVKERRVVYQRNLDITSAVLKRLNRGYAPTKIKRTYVPRPRRGNR